METLLTVWVWDWYWWFWPLIWVFFHTHHATEQNVWGVTTTDKSWLYVWACEIFTKLVVLHLDGFSICRCPTFGLLLFMPPCFPPTKKCRKKVNHETCYIGDKAVKNTELLDRIQKWERHVGLPNVSMINPTFTTSLCCALAHVFELMITSIKLFWNNECLWTAT